MTSKVQLGTHAHMSDAPNILELDDWSCSLGNTAGLSVSAPIGKCKTFCLLPKEVIAIAMYTVMLDMTYLQLWGQSFRQSELQKTSCVAHSAGA